MSDIVKAQFKITSWDESPYQEFDDGRKFTRAEVALAGTGGGLTSARLDALMYYRPDGTSGYVALMHVTADIDGRSGGFALRGEGTYDGTQARIEFQVLPDSGTGDLAGISGTGESVSTHDDYPFMPFTLSYVLA